MASPRQGLCPEWSPLRERKWILPRAEGKENKILPGPSASPHGNTCPPFHLAALLFTSPLQNPQVTEAISHRNDHSIPLSPVSSAGLQLRWSEYGRQPCFPHITEISPFQFWNPFMSKTDLGFFFFFHYCFNLCLFEISLFPWSVSNPAPPETLKFRDAWRELSSPLQS